MSDECLSRPAEQAELSERQCDQTVLDLLLREAAGDPWSLDELERMVGWSRACVLDAVARLKGAGLVNQTGDVVFPSLAARRASELWEEGI